MTDKKPLGGVVYHYCHNPGHVRRDCRKLHHRNRRFLYAHESLKGASTPSTLLVGSEVNLTHVLFPLPPSGSLAMEPQITRQVIPVCLLCFSHTLLPLLLPL